MSLAGELFLKYRHHVTEPQFKVTFVAAGTGSMVWDDPHAEKIIQRHLPMDRPIDRHLGPKLGIVHLGGVKPSPGILRNVVLTLGADVRAGRYGEFSLFITSEDEDTRHVIGDIASAQNVALFISPSFEELHLAEPAGQLTAGDRVTLQAVFNAGGTVTAAQFGNLLGVEQTTAGNRLVGLHKKGYLQRIEQPHPIGDLFIDPRSVRFEDSRT